MITWLHNPQFDLSFFFQGQTTRFAQIKYRSDFPCRMRNSWYFFALKASLSIINQLNFLCRQKTRGISLISVLNHFPFPPQKFPYMQIFMWRVKSIGEDHDLFISLKGFRHMKEKRWKKTFESNLFDSFEFSRIFDFSIFLTYQFSLDFPKSIRC